MKRSIGLILFAGLILLMTTPVYAVNYDDWVSSVTTAADALIGAQNDNGSFDWKNDGDSAQNAVGYNNTQGATARGLVAAYNVTGSQKYLTAANRVADYLVGLDSGNLKYNKDIEFMYELAAAGGNDYTENARNSALTYFQDKMNDYTGLSAAQAVRERYLQANWVAAPDVMNGTKLWMLGEWGHVAQLLGNTEIVTGYTGFDMAGEMGSLLLNDFQTWDYDNDTYKFLGIVGVLEASFFGDILNNGTSDEKDLEQEALNVLLQTPLSGWQDTGYATYVKSLYGIYDSTALINWIQGGDYTPSVTGANLESMGEGLLGLANAPVPEPATMALFGLGLIGLAGVGRRKKI